MSAVQAMIDEGAAGLEHPVAEVMPAEHPEMDSELETSAEKDTDPQMLRARWPGWPGINVFRVVVPVLKVGGIIGRKGDLIKKLVEETRARVRVLDGPATSPDRIVLISGKEEPDVEIAPAMEATIRIFKCINGLPENVDIKAGDPAAISFCLIRLLVPSTQAMSLIGKQGSVIKAIQDGSGASVRVLSHEELPIYADSDERIVELQGEALKVIPALESVLGHLRKFLMDHSVLPLFEKTYTTPVAQERPADAWSEKAFLHAIPQPSLVSDFPASLKRDPLHFGREIQLESHIHPSRLLLYGDRGLETHPSPLEIGSRSSALGRFGGPVVTQIAHTMQIPLAYAEDIIGVQGSNIDYIRRTSGAILTVQESEMLPDEITVEIKGTSSQVQIAQQLIQEFTGGHPEPLPGGYSNMEPGLRTSNPQLVGSSAYLPSVLSAHRYSGYSSSGAGGGHSSFRS